MDKIELGTPEGTAENIDKIAELFPQVVTEVENADGKLARAVDFDVLRDLLGDVAEGQRERYQFTWPGKREAKAEARRPIYKTMIPEPGKSKDWDTTENLYIEGDNFDALRLMKETYAGKVKLIFIDPPYNTGSDAFVYSDDFKQDESEYNNESGDYDNYGLRMVVNRATEGKYHSNWCSMLYQRLLLARDYLAKDGVIFITIDHVEFANLVKICDEIFGASCFAAHIAWRSSDNSNNNALTFSEDFNDIIVYSKTPGWKPNFLNDPEKRKHFKNPDNDPRGPWFDGNPVNNPGLRPNLQFDITTPSGKTIKHPSNGWRWSKEKMAEKFESGELLFSDDETRVIRRTYLCDMEGLPPSTLWIDSNKTGHTRRAKYELKALFPEIPVTSLFSTPKPVDLINYIMLLAITGSNDIVMDFFSGSSSTADSVMRYNAEQGASCRYIMMQAPELTDCSTLPTICAMGEERIRRAGAKITNEIDESNKQLELGAEPKPYPDLGFRVLRIDSSNFKDFYLTPGETAQESLFDFADNVKEGRSDLDLLFEVLPKLGIPYSAKIEERVLADKKVFFVDGDKLAACFDANVGSDTIEEMAKAKPWYAVIRDSSMADDATHANYEELFRTYSPDTVPQVI